VANNPVPVLTALSPTSVGAGSGAFTLTLTGSSFVSGSVAYFGPTALTTTFVSSTQLTATVPASLVTTAGSANVTVVNPAPVGGTSGAVAFAITSGTSSSPGTSCNTIRSSGATANGTYWVDPDGAGGNAAFQVYCDMANASGGWTMILMSTAGTTFSWGSAFWTNATTLNPTTTDPTSNVDMKNLAFSTLGFSEMRFCLDTTTNCITVSRSAASAMAVFSAGAVSASVSRATFMSWDPTADSAYSNMPNCNASGFNQQCVYSRCRFGITLNNENDCGSCDATIGFGCEQVAGGAYNTSYSSGGANWNTPYRFRGFLFVR
jgi:hypothetical protein